MTSPTTDSQVQAILENTEHIQSLLYLLNKLPELTAAVQLLEEKAAFVQHVLNDKQSLGAIIGEAEAKLESFHLTREHADAMIALAQKLPVLVESLENVEEWVLFVKQVVNDRQSLTYLAEGCGELPLVQAGADILKETNQRYRDEKDYANISLFRIYKLLKNPALVSGFRYLETLLEVIQKHSKS